MIVESNQEYSDQHFLKLHEEKKVFSAIEFYNCTFENCYLLECLFQKCTFTHCTFINCDISALKVTNSKFIEVVFESSKVIGVDWTQAGKVGSYMPLSLKFFQSTLTYSTFFGLNLAHIEVVKCIVHEVDFTDADISEGNFRETDFLESKFHNTNLSKADFRQARNYTIDPRANIVKKAKFSLPEAMTLLSGFDIILE